MEVDKRLLIFCTSNEWGGTEKNAFLRAKELTRFGFKTRLIVGGDYLYQRATAEGIEAKVISHPPKGSLSFSCIFSFLHEIKDFRANRLLMTKKGDYWYGFLAAFLAGLRTSSYIYLGEAKPFRRSLKNLLLFYWGVKGIIVNGPQIIESLKSSFPRINSRRIHMILNGFIPHTIDWKRQNKLKDELGLRPNAILLGASGRFTLQKGFDLIPEIMKQLPEHFHLAVAGDGVLKKEIWDQLVEMKLSHRVSFLGFLPSMSDFYRDIDLFVLMSRSEGMANVLNESMSFGTPVISTRVSGSELLLENGKFGPIVEIGDVEGIVRSILKQSAEGISKQQQLIDHISENYTIDKMMERTIAVLK